MAYDAIGTKQPQSHRPDNVETSRQLWQHPVIVMTRHNPHRLDIDTSLALADEGLRDAVEKALLDQRPSLDAKSVFARCRELITKSRPAAASSQ